MTTQNPSPVVPETEAKKKFRVSIPRTVVTHAASFLAGAAAYAGVKKLNETDIDANVAVNGETVLDV